MSAKCKFTCLTASTTTRWVCASSLTGRRARATRATVPGEGKAEAEPQSATVMRAEQARLSHSALVMFVYCFVCVSFWCYVCVCLSFPIRSLQGPLPGIN